MTKTDGEYELVLGNRQLLSAFFIIVILFGVFFTMGYVVGRNSAPPVASSPVPATVAANQRPETAPPAAVPAQQPPAPVEHSETPAVQATKEAKPAASIETKPAEPPAKSEKLPAMSEAPQPKKEALHERRPAPPVRESAPASSSSHVATVSPGPGNMYLQVVAVGQPQAGVVVDTLKQKGFPALLTQGPNAAIFRVMVGPFADAATLGKAKADLENAGFHPMVRK